MLQTIHLYFDININVTINTDSTITVKLFSDQPSDDYGGDQGRAWRGQAHLQDHRRVHGCLLFPDQGIGHQVLHLGHESRKGAFQ